MANVEKYFEEKQTEAKRLVDTFNRKNKKSVVYLKLTDGDFGSFQIHFRFNDKFVNSEYYDDGSAFIYGTEALYEEIQKLAGNRKVQWNNTASIGWLPY